MGKSQQLFQKRILSQQQLQNKQFVLGQAGERLAQQHLVQKGYQVLEQNIRLKNCEVDLIVLDTQKNELVFCEVKTRSTQFFGDPSTAVKRSKIEAMRRVARVYLTQFGWRGTYRFDVVSIVGECVDHYENVTWMER